MNFVDMQETLTDLIKLYRTRGLSLRSHVNPLLKTAGLATQASWSNTLTHIQKYDDSDINRSQFEKTISVFKKDLFNRILYDNKFVSVVDNVPNYDEIKAGLEQISYEDFDQKTASELISLEEDNICYKSSNNSTTAYIFKNIRKNSVKEELNINSLKLEYQNDGYDKLVAFVDILLPCFDSIVLDDDKNRIILSADLSSIFYVDHLRAALAHLRTVIRQNTAQEIKLTDKNVNFFPAIQKLYEEDIGNVKELAFKTDDGVAHYENAKRGISCIKDGDFHIAGSDVADIEAYRIKKTYISNTEKQENSVYLASSWYVLNGVKTDRRLGEATISASCYADFFGIIDKIINWSE